MTHGALCLPSRHWPPALPGGTVAGLDPGLNFDLVCCRQSKQPEISSRPHRPPPPPRSHPPHQSNTAAHPDIHSADCFPGVTCTFIGYDQIAPVARLENHQGFVKILCLYIFFPISILYTSSQVWTQPLVARVSFHYDYLLWRFSPGIRTRNRHTHLELGCNQLKVN